MEGVIEPEVSCGSFFTRLFVYERKQIVSVADEKTAQTGFP